MVTNTNLSCVTLITGEYCKYCWSPSLPLVSFPLTLSPHSLIPSLLRCVPVCLSARSHWEAEIHWSMKALYCLSLAWVDSTWQLNAARSNEGKLALSTRLSRVQCSFFFLYIYILVSGQMSKRDKGLGCSKETEKLAFGF